ncbi:MAG: hypothetical protein EU981_02465 [Candidatus Liberibacter ctenarytainae]|uniref:Uncharacterized protein n=1 Tax=Candidatus Liberibacter ctenarytainae TaxID=2020335 RepID=A0A937AQ84_9HYPH|nr:hypothetical protein [Candidatus Liberibacter ctenarytainae]
MERPADVLQFGAARRHNEPAFALAGDIDGYVHGYGAVYSDLNGDFLDSYTHTVFTSIDVI